MTYVFAGGVAVIGLLVAFQLFFNADIRRVVRATRWIVGGAAALLALFLIIRGQIGVGSIIGVAAWSILQRGRLGPIVFNSTTPSEENRSSVKSRFIAMKLDHATGAVSGRVVSGSFAGADLIDLGEADTRQLLREVSSDPDSLSLLETWLDKNRAGWREYFAERPQGPDMQETVGDDAQACEILGLKPGASADEIRAAHHNLMKGVHPDQGGSTFLASKINEARDRLLKKHRP